MQFVADRLEAPTAIRTDLGAIFISLELSRSSWVVTSLSPGGGEKMSKHTGEGRMKGMHRGKQLIPEPRMSRFERLYGPSRGMYVCCASRGSIPTRFSSKKRGSRNIGCDPRAGASGSASSC